MVGTQLERLLDFARSQIGRGERGANNSGPYVEALHRGARRRGNWCSAFVAHCLESVAVCPRIPDRNRRGAKALVQYLANDLGTGQWAIEPRRGRAPEYRTEPRAGDIIAWHRSPGASTWAEFWKDWRGHVEIVETYAPATDTMTTIAGNVGRFPARVQRRVHASGSWRRRLYGVARLGILGSQSNRAD